VNEIFELTNGSHGFRSRLSLHETMTGAVEAAASVYASYEEFRGDPDTEEIYDKIEWVDNGAFFTGRYSDSSYFTIRSVEVLR
jgi:hypothetical protein